MISDAFGDRLHSGGKGFPLAVVERVEHGGHQFVGSLIGGRECAAMGLAHRGCLLIAERGDVVGAPECVSHIRGQAGGDDGQQMHAASKLPKVDGVAVGPRRRIVRKRLGGNAGEERQGRWMHAARHLLGCVVEGIKALGLGEGNPSELVGALEVLARCIAWSGDRLRQVQIFVTSGVLK